ncbi:hypothetical protein F7725_012108, partial [Dissostichus mawsoni]
MVIANTVFSDEKNGSDVQLGASTIIRRVSAMSGNLTGQLDRDLAKCRWFSIQCDESVDKSNLVKSLKTGFVTLVNLSHQLSATFNVDAGQVEIDILTLQNDLHLKAHQDAPNFWCLVETEKYK